MSILSRIKQVFNIGDISKNSNDIIENLSIMGKHTRSIRENAVGAFSGLAFILNDMAESKNIDKNIFSELKQLNIPEVNSLLNKRNKQQDELNLKFKKLTESI